jgi:hypothetical protein
MYCTDELLKPCPFCGNKNISICSNHMDKEAVCSINNGGCGATIGWYVSIIKLRKAWNTRVKRVNYDKEAL